MMKYLKKYNEDINFDEWDEEEFDDISIKKGDYVIILPELYDKYPNWSRSRRYVESIKNKTHLFVKNVIKSTEYDLDDFGNKINERTFSSVHFINNFDNDAFYTPIDVVQKVN